MILIPFCCIFRWNPVLQMKLPWAKSLNLVPGNLVIMLPPFSRAIAIPLQLHVYREDRMHAINLGGDLHVLMLQFIMDVPDLFTSVR